MLRWFGFQDKLSRQSGKSSHKCRLNLSRQQTKSFSVPKKFTLLLLGLAILLSQTGRADEVTRQVQEELRKRHLFFSEIDGRTSADYALALRYYQERKGFTVSGVADAMTLYSLGVGEPTPPAEGAVDLPDVPVLRSDAAARAQNREARPTPVKANAASATSAEIRSFLRRYFDAGQSPNPADELAFYADWVDYFDHGVVDKTYIQNELAVYDQHWPSRKYALENSVRVWQHNGDTIAKVRVEFEVANLPRNRKARGRTDDTFGLAKVGDGLKIISMREERVRRPSRRRPNPAAAVGRTVHKVLRSIFH